jgi:hypothetical protein
MHILCCRRHHRHRCRRRGNVSLPHHHVSFFVVTVAITDAFATVAVIATIAAEAPKLSSPHLSTLGDRRPSAVVDGVIVVASLALSLSPTPLAPLMLSLMSTPSLVSFAPLWGALGQTLDDINAKALEDL